jgi:ectoine hydroxylase-related dioxygenase (phytanoyl-CoA dioxygenase family)
MRARKINLFHEHVLVKEPGTLEPTPWHHDLPYWTLEGTQVNRWTARRFPWSGAQVDRPACSVSFRL